MTKMTIGILIRLIVLVLTGFASIAAAQSNDEALVEIVGVGDISTQRNEAFPTIDPVTGSIWYSSYDESFDEQTITYARWNGVSWSTPEVASFSGQWGDRAPRFSQDGATIYFSSNRPLADNRADTGMHIWTVHRQGDSWGPPVPLAPPVNSDSNDMHVSATDDAIWFASTREGGFGRSDIYRLGMGDSLVHLAAPINDENSQPDLWVSADESWMILVITGAADGYGGDDLYVTKFDGSRWSKPVNLGPEINSEEYEYGPSVSPDGQYLYFTSHRGGSADIYRVPVARLTKVNSRPRNL